MKRKKHYSNQVAILVSSFLFLAIIGFILYIFYSTTSKNILVIGDKTTSIAVSVVNEFLSENMDIITLESEAVEYMMKNGASKGEISRYLVESSTGYQKGIDDKFSGFYGVIRGSYVDGSGWYPGKDYRPMERPWYRAALRGNGETTVSSPYTDQYFDDVRISIVRQLSEKDCAIGVDISLKQLDDLVAQISADGYGTCLILDADGMVVASSCDSAGTNYLNGSAGEDKKALAERVFEQDEPYFEMRIDGENYIVFSKSELKDWQCIILMDKNSMFADTYKNMLICSVASLVLMGLILYFCDNSYRKRVAMEKTWGEMKAASSIYTMVCSIDLQKDTFEIISGHPHVLGILGENRTLAADTIQKVMVSNAREDYIDKVRSFFNFKTLNERLSDVNTLTLEYYEKVLCWCQARFIVVDRDKNGVLNQVLFALEDINVAKNEKERIISESRVDKLTGCLNRKAYEEDISYYTHHFAEKDIVYFAIDVNGLKSINDEQGHDAGDELIVGAAYCLKMSFGSTAKLYRVGGDEFQAIVRADDKALNNILNRIKESVADWKGKQVDGLSISVGYAKKRDNPDMTVREIIKLADKNMYEEKAKYYRENGRDRRGSV